MIPTVLLTGGPHPFAATTPILEGLLVEAGCDVTIVDHPDRLADELDDGGVEVVVLNTLRWRMLADRHAALQDEYAYVTTPRTATAIEQWIRGGGRVLACHGAPICFDDWPGWGELLGARWDWDRSSHPPLGEVDVIVADPDHPLVVGMSDFTIIDECYGFLERADGFALRPLLAADHGGVRHPLLWTRCVDAGRVVVSLLGHGPESYQHATHAEVLRRAVHWLDSETAGS